GRSATVHLPWSASILPTTARPPPNEAATVWREGVRCVAGTVRRDDCRRRRYNSRLPTRRGTARPRGVRVPGHNTRPLAYRFGMRAAGRSGRARSFATGRLFVTAARHNGADVRPLADSLIARAAASGGQLTSAEVANAVEDAEVNPSLAKKLLRTLAEAGVTVVVDDSNNRRRVAAARSATPASRAATAKAAPPVAEAKPAKAAKAAPERVKLEAVQDPEPAKAAPAKRATARKAEAAAPVE